MGSRHAFEIEESQASGVRRLSVTGDLDHLSARILEDRLAPFRALRSPVRLDLSRLDLVDSTGIRLLIQCVGHARMTGWRFQIERDLAPQVLGVFTLMRLERILECA